MHRTLRSRSLRARSVLAITAMVAAGVGVPVWPAAPAVAAPCTVIAVRTLDGSCNNLANPTWGQTNTPYLRVAPARYARRRLDARSTARTPGTSATGSSTT